MNDQKHKQVYAHPFNNCVHSNPLSRQPSRLLPEDKGCLVKQAATLVAGEFYAVNMADTFYAINI